MTAEQQMKANGSNPEPPERPIKWLTGNTPPNPDLDLSVVIPVHDEADNIESLIQEIRTNLNDRIRYEVVCVDDGSTDQTATRLHDQEKEFSGLRIVRHAQNCGQSAALRSGVRAARAALIATLDGDGQNDPQDIPRLLEVFKSNQSLPSLLVAGQRLKRRDTLVKRISSLTANSIRAGLLKDNTPDTGCGLKVFRREDFIALPYFDHMHRFLPALFIREGGTVISVPVNHRPREHGRTHYGLFDRLWVGVVDLLGVFWLQRRSKIPRVEEVSKREH